MTRDLRPEMSFPAYSLRFEESSYDEGVFAEQVARDLGLKPVPVWVKPEDLPATLADLVSRVGEPLADPAWIPTALLAQRATQDVKLVLAGEGGDELFGGYPTHLAAQWGERYSHLPKGLQAAFRLLVQKWPVSDKKVTVSFFAETVCRGHAPGRHRAAYALEGEYFAGGDVAAWDGGPFSACPGIDDGRIADDVQRVDLKITLAEGLLTKSDRAGMRSRWKYERLFSTSG